MSYTKLFNSILDSTIWQEPIETKIVWITMLAMCNRNGEVLASIPGLAKRAGVTIPECESALKCLLSPDPYSRTKDNDGRRIVEIEGGWELLNHAKYRELLSTEERRAYNARKQAEYREKKRQAEMSKNVNDTSMTVNHNVSSAHITDADTDTDALEISTKVDIKQKPQKKFVKPTIDELRYYCKEIGHQETDGDGMFYMWEGNGWKNGSNPCKDWKATVRRYAHEGWLKSQKEIKPKLQSQYTKQPQTYLDRHPNQSHLDIPLDQLP